jgi:hypothetical protein
VGPSDPLMWRFIREGGAASLRATSVRESTSPAAASVTAGSIVHSAGAGGLEHSDRAFTESLLFSLTLRRALSAASHILSDRTHVPVQGGWETSARLSHGHCRISNELHGAADSCAAIEKFFAYSERPSFTPVPKKKKGKAIPVTGRGGP